MERFRPNRPAPGALRWLLSLCAAAGVVGPASETASGQDRRHAEPAPVHVLDTKNPDGTLRSITLDGSPLATGGNAFFQSLGTNGRSCVSCHVPAAGWSVTPPELRKRFRETDGLDPIFRTNDGSNSPNADVRTVAARREAYSMLLNKGVIRVGLPVPANAEFELIEVDDPYGFASAAELSLFRRPLPTTNLRFITGVMWDGRESFAPMGTTPILSEATAEENMDALIDNLMHQANDATVGHAQAAAPLTEQQRLEIVAFELNLATAQQVDAIVGRLDTKGAAGGAEAVAAQRFYVTINDVLGADVETGRFDAHAMTLFDAWASSDDRERAAIARGAALFGAPIIEITGVGGLNDDLAIPVIRGSCTSCHDSPNIGNHSVALPIDIGLTDASRRTADMPLYTLRNKTTGEIRRTTDPGRALLTGRWKDIGKFKGPVLRGLASRPPYFHDGSAADLGEAIEFYDTRFNIGLTDEEKIDLIRFLSTL